MFLGTFFREAPPPFHQECCLQLPGVFFEEFWHACSHGVYFIIRLFLVVLYIGG